MRLNINSALLLGAAVLTPSVVVAQTPAVAAPAAVELKVGDMAPDFTLTSSTQNGVQAPVKLSSLRGKTVVLAFFPRARTAGCTKEMETFRDQYGEIFGGGKSATLYPISTDSASVTASWASDAKFPFTFLADVNLDAAKLYGTAPARGTGLKRDTFIVGPDGRITRIMRSVNPIDPTSYTDLASAIVEANKKKH